MSHLSDHVLWVIDDEDRSAALNMALDDVFLHRALAGTCSVPLVRMYGFERSAVTVGRFYQTKDDPLVEDALRRCMPVTRRITGGGAVVHEGDLTYSFIAHESMHSAFESVPISYAALHLALARALRSVGVDCSLHDTPDGGFMGRSHCFVRPVEHDVMVAGAKVAGAAQKRIKGFFLHQGTIVLPEGLLGERHHEILTGLPVALVRAFAEHFGLHACYRSLEPDELTAARTLVRDKYENKEWVLKY